jgi:hypothetical protein
VLHSGESDNRAGHKSLSGSGTVPSASAAAARTSGMKSRGVASSHDASCCFRCDPAAPARRRAEPNAPFRAETAATGRSQRHGYERPRGRRRTSPFAHKHQRDGGRRRACSSIKAAAGWRIRRAPRLAAPGQKHPPAIEQTDDSFHLGTVIAPRFRFGDRALVPRTIRSVATPHGWIVAIGIAGSGRVGTIALQECDRRPAGAVGRSRTAEFWR